MSRVSGPVRRVSLCIAVVVCGVLGPREAAAQFSDPCGAACALTLGATGMVAATGTAVAVGRLAGGLSTTSDGLLAWGAGLAVVVGGGIALHEDGARQERAVYAAAIGAASGSLVSLGVAALNDGSDGARMLAASLIGAAAGAVAGGVYGALSHDEGSAGGSVPLLRVSLPF